MTRTRRVAVVGGGITGLAAARFLRRDGFATTVFEAADRVGGRIATSELAGAPFDVGADAFLARQPDLVELCHELGLGDDLVAPATGNVLLWFRDGMRPLPGGTVMGVPGDLEALVASGVLDGDGVAAVRREAELPPPDLGPQDDPPLRDFVVGRWGADVADRLVDPLVSGVYAGDIRRLGLRSATPALAAVVDEAVAGATSVQAVLHRRRADARDDPRPVFNTVRGGLSRLVDALAREAGGIRTATAVERLTRGGGGSWIVAGEEFDHVVVAVAPRLAARLVADVAPDAAARLAEVRQASSVVVALAFPPQATLPEGSGMLVPRAADRLLKAATWSSQKWPHLHASDGDGLVRLRCSAGRIDDPGPVDLHDDALVARVLEELAEAVGIEHEPLDVVVTRWREALPQYDAGHLAAMAGVRLDARAAGLSLAGNAHEGVGLPACIRSARRAAAEVVERAGRP